MNWQVQKIEFLLAEHPIMIELEIIIFILEHFQIMSLMNMDFLEEMPGGYSGILNMKPPSKLGILYRK